MDVAEHVLALFAEMANAERLSNKRKSHPNREPRL
jgi:hypothetical protein